MNEEIPERMARVKKVHDAIGKILDVLNPLTPAQRIAALRLAIDYIREGDRVANE